MLLTQAAGSNTSDMPGGHEAMGSTDLSAGAMQPGRSLMPGAYLGGEGWIALVDLAQAVQHLGQL